MRSRLFVILLLAGSSANASVIDFEFVQGAHFEISQFSTGGILFQEIYFENSLWLYDENTIWSGWDAPDPLGHSGLLVQTFSGEGPQVNLFDADGGSFSLNSFVSTTDANFGIYARKTNGDDYSEYVQDLYSENIGNGLTVYYLPDTYIGLEYVHMEGPDPVFGSGGSNFFLDNIQVNESFTAAVPLPPAVWLFGWALAGLGWMRHKPSV